jgi:hypothetical protein
MCAEASAGYVQVLKQTLYNVCCVWKLVLALQPAAVCAAAAVCCCWSEQQ